MNDEVGGGGVGLINLFDFFLSLLILDFMHVCFRHANHDEIGENVKEEDCHTDEKNCGDVRIDERGELPSDQAKVCDEHEMVYSEEGMRDIFKTYQVELVPRCRLWHIVHGHT